MVALVRVLAVAAALATNAAAWPHDDLVARQDSLSVPQSTPAPTQPPSSSKQNANTGDLNTGGRTDLPSQSGSSNATTTNTGNSTRPTQGQMFNPMDPPAGINMIKPTTTAGTVLYRIGKTITFQWNYTSLQGTPTAVDVLVAATTATMTWTLTHNMTFEPTATYTWDTNQFQQTSVNQPLLTDEYGLIIVDSDRGVSAPAAPGYLATFSGLKFGMYESQPYKDLSEFHCVTCSAASRDLDRKAGWFAVTMAAVTFLSFTWFVTGFGGLP